MLSKIITPSKSYYGLILNDYYEFNLFRTWVIMYYPKLFNDNYMGNLHMTHDNFVNDQKDFIKHFKEINNSLYNLLGDFKDINEAIRNFTKNSNIKSVNKEIQDNVASIIEGHDLSDQDILEEYYWIGVLNKNIPLDIDKKLLWTCPVKCIRKYLKDKHGWKTHWYHKLFWKGKWRFEN